MQLIPMHTFLASRNWESLLLSFDHLQIQINTVFKYTYVRSQGSKIALIRSYLRVPKASGQVKILIFLEKNNFFPIYANNFCDAEQVPIFKYFEAWINVPPFS